MDGAERKDRTLRRIMALLVSFAVLAERAAGRSFPIRWLVLAILRQAERVARAYVAEATSTDWPRPEDTREIGSGSVDAVCLAQRFRALAAALSLLLPSACSFGRPPIRVDRAPRRPAPHGRRCLPTRRPARWFCDTS